MKKVAILINSLRRGGAERVAASIINSFKDQYKFYLVTFVDCYLYTIPENTIRIKLKSSSEQSGISKFSSLFFMAKELSYICNEENIDLVFSMMYRPNYVTGIAKSTFGLRAQIIMNERSFPSNTYATNSISNLLCRQLVKKYYKKATLVLTNSRASALDLEENFNISNKIKTIYNPIDLTRFKAERHISKVFTFICVGNFHSYKNQELIIDAFFNLGIKNASLIFIGDGKTRHNLDEKVKNQGLGNSIKFLGKVNDVERHLVKADCFISASSREGFPNVILEALACGLPVISSDCNSGPRELLSPKSDFTKLLVDNLEYAEYGILFPVGNNILLEEAMKRVYSDKHLTKQYSKKAVLRAGQFDINKIMRQYKEVIDEYTSN